MTLPWQPAKTAPENKHVLVLTDRGEMIVALRQPTKDSFLGKWITFRRQGRAEEKLIGVAIGWPIAWTDLPDLPSSEEIEKFREIQ